MGLDEQVELFNKEGKFLIATRHKEMTPYLARVYDAHHIRVIGGEYKSRTYLWKTRELVN